MAPRGRPKKFLPPKNPANQVCTKCGKEKPKTDFNLANSQTGKRQLQCKACHNPAARKNTWARQGIEIDEGNYEAMSQKQGGACAICGELPRGDGRLRADHDHDSGQLRDLLCGSCNSGLGMFGDDPEVLEKARAYLLRHRSARKPGR